MSNSANGHYRKKNSFAFKKIQNWHLCLYLSLPGVGGGFAGSPIEAIAEKLPVNRVIVRRAPGHTHTASTQILDAHNERFAARRFTQRHHVVGGQGGGRSADAVDADDAKGVDGEGAKVADGVYGVGRRCVYGDVGRPFGALPLQNLLRPVERKTIIFFI
jgi:hypothetical protein